jgi:hypothetical protein
VLLIFLKKNEKKKAGDIHESKSEWSDWCFAHRSEFPPHPEFSGKVVYDFPDLSPWRIDYAWFSYMDLL